MHRDIAATGGRNHMGNPRGDGPESGMAPDGAGPGGLGDMKFLAPPRQDARQAAVPRRAAPGWLVLAALGVIPLAALVAWALLRVLLAIVFARTGAH